MAFSLSWDLPWLLEGFWKPHYLLISLVFPGLGEGSRGHEEHTSHLASNSYLSLGFLRHLLRSGSSWIHPSPHPGSWWLPSPGFASQCFSGPPIPKCPWRVTLPPFLEETSHNIQSCSVAGMGVTHVLEGSIIGHWCLGRGQPDGVTTLLCGKEMVRVP